MTFHKLTLLPVFSCHKATVPVLMTAFRKTKLNQSLAVLHAHICFVDCQGRGQGALQKVKHFNCTLQLLPYSVVIEVGISLKTAL